MNKKETTAKIKYKHIRTGNVYAVYDSCKLKISGEWVEGIIYFNVNNGSELFVRAEHDFLNKFKEILDE